jgi:GDP-L-fucose synthase
MIEANIIHAAHDADVERVLFLGSSCVYPKFAEQPIHEDSLLSGPLEPTNEWYAIAKIAGIKLIQAYRIQYGRDWISAMPTNLYGPGDDYDLQNSHVLPALLRKFHEAKKNGDEEVIVWGTGSPLREFMHCDDVADALVFLLKEYSAYEPINIGSGIELTIKELAEIIAEVVGFDAKITWDMNMPNGTPRKLMDSSRLRDLGWNNVRPLINGIRSTYAIHFNSQN